MKQKHYLGSAVVLGLALATAGAQVSITSGPGLSYTQGWGTGYTPGTPSWTDNSVFTGWYAYQFGTSGAPPTYTVNTTTSSAGVGLFHLIAAAADTSNFGFGGRVNDGTGGAQSNPDSGYYIGLRLSNDTGSTLSEFALGYTGAQFYRAADSTANTITVSYQLGSPANLLDGTWNGLSGLTFTAPNIVGAAAALNFNLAGNQTVFSPVTVSGLSWAPGTDLWIRFKINNTSGIDQGMLIDNVNFVAAVPEPATAALMGLGLVVLIARQRSRK
jgi:hypothetical protein